MFQTPTSVRLELVQRFEIIIPTLNSDEFIIKYYFLGISAISIVSPHFV